MEHSIHLVCHNSAKKLTLFDPVGACRITRLLANIRRILDEHGRQHAPKSSSSARVDEDFWYMRGRYKLCTTNDEPDNEEGWPYSSIFHTRSENAIPLNASLSKMASNATYDQTKVENLKSLLFKDWHDSWTEFINLRTNRCPSGVGEKRKRGQCDCCLCWYKRCNHYGAIKGLSKKSLAYYRAVCPMCVMTVSPSCSQFWNCCIVRLHFGKKFSSLCEAEAFACGCHHVKYEKSFIDFCLEGNIYENSR